LSHQYFHVLIDVSTTTEQANKLITILLSIRLDSLKIPRIEIVASD